MQCNAKNSAGCEVRIRIFEGRSSISDATQHHQAIHYWHGDIKKNQVWLILNRQLHCVDTIIDLSSHLIIGLLQEQFE